MKLGVWNPISGIPDFLSCIPNSKTQESAFHELIFTKFQFPQANLSRTCLHGTRTDSGLRKHPFLLAPRRWGRETSPAEQAKLIWDRKFWIHQLLVHISYPIKPNKTASIPYMHARKTTAETMQSMFYWECANNLIAVPNVVLLSCRTQLFPSTLALQQHDRATAV